MNFMVTAYYFIW